MTAPYCPGTPGRQLYARLWWSCCLLPVVPGRGGGQGRGGLAEAAGDGEAERGQNIGEAEPQRHAALAWLDRVDRGGSPRQPLASPVFGGAAAASASHLRWSGGLGRARIGLGGHGSSSGHAPRDQLQARDLLRGEGRSCRGDLLSALIRGEGEYWSHSGDSTETLRVSKGTSRKNPQLFKEDEGTCPYSWCHGPNRTVS